MKEIEIHASFKRFIRDLGKLADKLVKGRIRALVVLSGSDPVKQGVYAARLISYYVSKWKKLDKSRKIKGLYMHHDEFPDAIELKDVFSESLAKSRAGVDLEYAVYEKSEKYLGITVQILVLDLTKDLKPNDVGRLVGIVEGGGIVVLLTPPWDDWDQFKTIFKETLTVPQHPEPRHVFITWFKRKLLEHEGVGIYDLDNNKIIKKIELTREIKEYKSEIVLPKERAFPKEVYEHALTMDQVNVIKILEHFYEKPGKGKKKVFVLTADRGRGKSCAIGIGLVGLATLFRKIKPRFRAIVTAPSPSNIQSLMMLAMSVLDKLQFKYDVFKKSGYIVEIRGERLSIEYWEPIVVPKLKADIVVVDEAAGIHVPLLYKILDAHNRLIFSSTIHGYEGAGRGFSVRFLKRLKSMENIVLFEYEMTEPIRYNYNDPVEEWQFKTLLLDAEPAELDEKDLEDIEQRRLIYVKYTPEELFNNEKELRELFGIYVLAHYRNEPDDLGMLADAPHHIIRAVKTSSGKIVCAIQLAEEGPIDRKMVDELLRGGKIPGNIIPDRFLKHTRLIEFADTKGWRIVRIATHPAVQGRGVGSWALEMVFEEVRERGLDWLGSGFGVTEELLRFWVKNGFSVVHISPDRNPVSGEYTVLVLKPVSETASKLVEIAKYEFKSKILNSIAINYRELEPGVVYLILNSEPFPLTKEELVKLISPVALDRLWTYCKGPMTFEAAADLMHIISRFHWLLPMDNRPRLSRDQELLLVTKGLQGLTWDEAAEIIGKSVKQLQEEGHEIACIYYEYIASVDRDKHIPGVSYLSYRRGLI